MSDHATEPGATATAEPTEGASGLRFEKQELESFVADDTHAGRAIGQLLSALFLVLLFLMVGATVWTSRHQNVSDDPYATVTGSADDAHGGH